MQAAENVMFTQMHANKEINLFSERDIASTIKEFKKLDKVDIQGKTVVIPLKPDELTDAERTQAL